MRKGNCRKENITISAVDALVHCGHYYPPEVGLARRVAVFLRVLLQCGVDLQWATPSFVEEAILDADISSRYEDCCRGIGSDWPESRIGTFRVE
jgi:hypothetical protein